MKRRKPKNHLHNLRPLTLQVTSMSRSGAGVARDENNRVTFIPFTAPGDLVKVKITKATNKFAEAQLLEIIEPSAQRIEPKCAVFTRCGGCQWQHLPYELQWQTKVNGVRDSLKLKQIDLPKHFDEFPAKQIWHYRNRIQLKGNASGLGFYETKSNDLVTIDQCPIANEKLNDVIPELLEEAKKESKPYKVELSLSIDGNVTKTWNSHHGAEGFRQVNDEQNINLQNWIKENLIKNNRGDDIAILDLYGGSGNLSKPLIQLATEIHCVDLNVPDTNENLPEYFHFHRSSVLPWLKQQKLNKDRQWIALIDPPRSGLGDELLEMLQCLKKSQVNTIILVGCKTDPWSRDIAQMLSNKWSLEKVAVLDFFPQTTHVESVAILTQQKRKKKTTKSR